MNWTHLALLLWPLPFFAICDWLSAKSWFDRITDRLGFPCSEDEWVN